MARALSTSAAVTMRGGTKRTTVGPAGTRSRPSSEALPTTSPDWTPQLAASSRPLMRPQPRTSLRMAGYFWMSLPRPARSCSPLAATLARMLSLSMAVRTHMAAAQARGLPPKVLAWVPGVRTSQRSLQAIMPIGTPPPSPFAVVNTSGSTPTFSYPHRVPVRPTPTWTSSKISSAPVASHSSLAFLKNAFSPGLTPPSPCKASIMIPARQGPSLLTSATTFSRSSTLLYST
mmetsp:Transcript_26588/g.45807  ORF Transcript_26588/g.45807 Transcript_26588/m.45807 type:complete len:232 (-) Transcript_26588:821-1516(-)